jgi:MoxR-like ATPase
MADYVYTKEFNPPTTFRAPGQDTAVADQREGRVYVFNEDIVLAVNVALATGRPVLVRGESGTGKSSLARSAANFLKWRFYEKVITSRTQARDLLYEVDLLRRLHDAQVVKDGGSFDEDYTRYVVPQALWWAFSRKTALKRGRSGNRVQPPAEPKTDFPDSARAVVLIDEIDKADPDVPNNLLVPLGSLQFLVEETGFLVKADKTNAPLVFITTNEERELPPAFLRRCVELKLEMPGPERLLDIAHAHFQGKDKWVKGTPRL